MPRPTSSADQYPPVNSTSYNPLTYQNNDATASTDFFDGAPLDSPKFGSHPNDSSVFFGTGGATAGQQSGYGERYSDGHNGPPESMLRSHAIVGKSGRHGLLAGKRKRYGIVGAVVLLAVVVAAVAGGVAASKHSSQKTSIRQANGIPSGASISSGSNGIAAIEDSAVTGGNGTTITTEDGTSFTYVNNFGGYWSSVPFDDSARPQSWVPALNESWDYTNNKLVTDSRTQTSSADILLFRIFGVNMGGWLVLEPFIVPGAFEPYENDTDPAVDEYTLMGKWGANATALLTQHYDTFITEQDFALIAGAGMSWVRIALPFWAIETIEGEPFVEGVAWTYFLK